MLTYNALHTYIQDRNYTAAHTILARRPRFASERFIRKGEFPLHMALAIEAPEKLILELIDAYPRAATVTLNGDNITYALKLAQATNASSRVINALNRTQREVTMKEVSLRRTKSESALPIPKATAQMSSGVSSGASLTGLMTILNSIESDVAEDEKMEKSVRFSI